MRKWKDFSNYYNYFYYNFKKYVLFPRVPIDWNPPDFFFFIFLLFIFESFISSVKSATAGKSSTCSIPKISRNPSRLLGNYVVQWVVVWAANHQNIWQLSNIAEFQMKRLTLDRDESPPKKKKKLIHTWVSEYKHKISDEVALDEVCF